MSLYIPGMEMPTSCSKCPFCDDDFDDNYFGLCCLLTGTRFDGDERISDCPLFEVQPHGRLGDLDAMLEFVDAGHLRHPHILSWSDRDVEDMIESRATIIPEDKEATDE